MVARKQLLGVVIALPAEARAFLGRQSWQTLDGRRICRTTMADATPLVGVIAGVGYKKALAAAQWLVQNDATELAAVGVAGGLVPDVKSGDLVLAESVCENPTGTAATRYAVDRCWAGAVQSALAASGLSSRRGAIFTSRQAVLTTGDKKALSCQSHALAVDMESAALARVAVIAGYPFFVLRAICDAAGQSVPEDLFICLDSNGRVSPSALLRALTRRPGLAMDMLKLQRDFSAALARLKLAGRVLRNGKRLVVSDNGQ